MCFIVNLIGANSCTMHNLNWQLFFSSFIVDMMNYIQPLIKNRNYINGKINPKTIGYICPNGNINFATKENALEYAKNYIVKALRSNPPYERGVVIKNSTIIANIDGDAVKVNYGNIDLTDTIIAHGHPRINGDESPLSLGDVITSINNDVKEVIAYNQKGEFSKLTVLSHSKILSKLLPRFLHKRLLKIKHKIYTQVLTNMYNEFVDNLRIEASGKDLNKIKKELNDIFQTADENTQQTFQKWSEEHNTKGYGDFSQLPANIKEVIQDAYNFISLLRENMHSFWNNNAKTLNMRYKTNYTK